MWAGPALVIVLGIATGLWWQFWPSNRDGWPYNVALAYLDYALVGLIGVITALYYIW